MPVPRLGREQHPQASAMTNFAPAALQRLDGNETS